MSLASTTVAVAQEAADSGARRAGLLALVLFSSGHFCADVYSGALGALQPLLVERFGMTLADAGLLGGMLVFSSSMMQPAYGYLSDRFPTRLFAALGPGLAGIVISSLGLAPSYGWLLLMIALGGAGIAAFHPQAASRAIAGVVRNRAGAMAVFISAGTLGFAAGPTYFSLISARLGLGRTWWAAIPGILISVLMLALLPEPPAQPRTRGAGIDWAALRGVAGPLTLLYLLVFIRSIIQITYAQFIPLYLHMERGFTLPNADYALSLYLVFGALGGLAGGQLADRFGGPLVITVSMIGSVPFLALFFLAHGWLSVLGLLAGGLILLFTIPVNVVMAQDLVPSQAGTVSALMMGFAWGTAGVIFIPLTGWVADRITLHYALMALTVFPVAGFFLSLRLLKGRRCRKPSAC
jgi:FSR family fosmidomycin resistance protein-like MFS transporter